jgi:hypothetical protein
MRNQLRKMLGITAVLVVAGSALVPAAARGAPASLPAARGGTWSALQFLRPAPGLDAVSSYIGTLSCGSPGNCAAGGSVSDSGGVPQAMVLDEVNGWWRVPRVVPGSEALNTGGYAEVTSVSCWSAGNCAAGGDYMVPVSGSRSSARAFVVTEVNGTWGPAQPVPGITPSALGSMVTSVSCTANGTCVAGGNDDATGASAGFVTGRDGGSWTSARDIHGLGGLSQVSCGAPGDCGAISGDQVATSAGGEWGSAGHLAMGNGLSASGEVYYASISCPDAGSCVVGGRYGDAHANDAVVAGERGGQWGPVRALRGLANHGGPAGIGSVSCSGPGDCAVGGDYVTGDKGFAFVAAERAGRWGIPLVVPGLPARAGVAPLIDEVSCPPGPAGDCAYAGEWGSEAPSATTSGLFLGGESDGTWGRAQLVKGGTAGALRALSCPAAGLCAAGGQAGPAPGTGFVLRSATPTATRLAIVRGLAPRERASGGQVKIARATVWVLSRNGGTPGGQVLLIDGTATICAITLTGGTGRCLLSAAALRPGAAVLARYLGSAEFFGSASPAVPSG